jgi:hypothetical protein
LCELLHTELGIAPSAQTRQLDGRLLMDDSP